MSAGVDDLVIPCLEAIPASRPLAGQQTRFLVKLPDVSAER